MNKEIYLLKLLLKKELFNTYNSIISINELKRISREIAHLYEALFSLHEQTESDLTVVGFTTYFWAKYPEAKQGLYGPLFEELAGLEVVAEEAEAVLSAITRTNGSFRLAEAALAYGQGKGSPEELQTILEALKTSSHAGKKYSSVPIDLEGIVDSISVKPGIRWRLQFLNKSLGSLRPGDFGVMFKRPETGGTLFVADTAAHALDQVTQPVIWFNNEEQDQKVILRIYQAYFGVTKDQLFRNYKEANAKFKERVGDKFMFFGINYCNKSDIEAILAEYKPSLVLYDQMAKVKGFQNDREDLKLGYTFQFGREMCKVHGHAAIAVHQADGSAENQKWLTMDHVANAKTAIQAEADWILGMGMLHGPENERDRFLNISKNKLLQDSDSIEALRHGRQQVRIRPDIMRLEDIVKYE